MIWSKALEVSRNAISCGAVIPFKTHKYKSNEEKCDYELRFLNSPVPKYLVEYGPKRNPFIPWDPRLQIERINNKHTLILNKYPVQLGHMLLITNNWEAQNGWLNIKDFQAITKVDNDTTGLWFFNSSKVAGASQPHRHFQLLRREINELICPRYEWFCSLLNNKNKISSDLSKSISIRPRKLYENNRTNELYSAYESMCIEMELGKVNIDLKPLKAYNLLITKEWIALIIRSIDRSYGFNINALGFAGYFLGTNKSEVEVLTKFGPDEILRKVVEPVHIN